MTDKAILFDATRCTACRGCQSACKQWNENDEVISKTGWTKTSNTGSYENPPDLSPSTWVKMEFRESETNGKVRWLFTRRSCMHCTDAACVRVCPTGALFHDENGGFVSYDKDLCSGCGYCLDACPFEVPRSTRNLLTGVAKMDKCTFCTSPSYNRIAEGLTPACVKTCPTKALTFGDRSQLIAEAKKKVDSLKANGFGKAYLYGERELGGLHVMYILDESPEVYGLPLDPKVPPETIAWKSILQPLGWAVGGLTLVGLGLNYLVAREAKQSKEHTSNKEK